MADYSLLAKALEEEEQRSTASNPWLMAGRAVSSVKPSMGRSPWEGIAAALAQGLIGGGLQGYGMQQVRDEKADFSNRYAQALGAENPIAAFQSDQVLAPYAQDVALTQQMREQNMADRRYETIANALAQEAAATGDFSKLQSLKQDGSFIQPQTLPEATFASPGTAIDPMTAKVMKNYQALRSMDRRSPRGEILETARALTRPDIQAQDRYLKEIEQERESAAALSQLGSRVSSAMATLGESTGFGSSLSQGLRRIAQYDPEKTQAYEVLESVFPEVVKAQRWPGAMSNMEINALRMAGPGGGNQPETNRYFADVYSGLGQLGNQYADWLEEAVTRHGMTPMQARSAWAKAKAETPSIVQGDKGFVRFNPEALTIADRLRAQISGQPIDATVMLPQMKSGGAEVIQREAAPQYEIRVGKDGKRYKVLLGQ